MKPLLAPVYAFQDAVCKASSHVFALPFAVGFLMFWIGLYYGTNGKIDPNFGLGNMLINGSGWIISIATCSIAARTASLLDLHQKIDALHKRLDAPRDRYIIDAEALREVQASDTLLERNVLVETNHRHRGV